MDTGLHVHELLRSACRVHTASSVLSSVQRWAALQQWPERGSDWLLGCTYTQGSAHRDMDGKEPRTCLSKRRPASQAQPRSAGCRRASAEAHMQAPTQLRSLCAGSLCRAVTGGF